MDKLFMARVIWLLSWLLIQTTLADKICEICLCVDKTADCSKHELKTQFDDAIWNTTEATIKNIKLEDNGFTHIKAFPKLGIEFLSLANNSIASIEDGAFKLLSNLTKLDLSNNLLHSDELRPDIFRGLYSPQAYEPLMKLKTLYLSNNELHTLHPDLFEHLPKLETLFIDNNPFKYIDKPTIIALSSIQTLKILDLSNTQLATLPQYMLHTPRLLSVLDLSDNQFTTIPDELQHTHSLNTLILDGNPIKSIDNFPTLADLEVLQLNWMTSLEKIGPGALSNLTKLKDLRISHNVKLTEISSTALSKIPTDGSEGRIWPPLKRLYLNSNQLGYLDSNLVGRWDLLDAIDLKGNPWVCDCRNQWMVSTLLPRIRKMPTHLDEGIVCREPIEMRGISMEDLQERHYHMRCLDVYGHRPERDGALLIGLFIGLFLAVPFTMAAVILYKRRNLRPQNFSRAFYKPADSKQFFVNT